MLQIELDNENKNISYKKTQFKLKNLTARFHHHR